MHLSHRTTPEFCVKILIRFRYSINILKYLILLRTNTNHKLVIMTYKSYKANAYTPN